MNEKPTVFLGSKGGAVSRLTALLKQHGYWTLDVRASFDTDVEAAVGYFQSTHQGPDGKMLVPDGVVGPKTWWALQNAAGAAQRSNIKPSIPEGLGASRRRVLEIALAEHAKGVREVPAGSNRGPELDRYLPDFTKQPGKQGPAWCCFFYSWVVLQGLGAYPLGRRHGSCSAARQDAAERGLWLPTQVAIDKGGPMPGDAFILARGHIGFVLRASDTQINTVEGNCGNRVKVGVRDLNDAQMLGFINNVPTEWDAFERGVLPAQHVAVDSVR